MVFRPWKLALCLGSLAAVVSAFLGESAQLTVLLICSISTSVGIPIAVRINKTTEPGPWIGIALSTLLILVGSLMRTSGVESSFLALRIPDYISAFGYIALIFSGHRLRKLRSTSLDPTSLIDAIALTLAVGVVYWAAITAPYLANVHTVQTARNSFLMMCLLDLALFFVVARLAIGPGAKTISYYFAAAATFGTLLSDIVISSSESAHPFFGAETLGNLIPAVSLITCLAAAMHPTMVTVTKKSTVQVPRMTRARLTTMMLAVLVPPFVVGFRVDQAPTEKVSLAVLATACGVVAMLMMGRFAGIAFARERAADLERTLAAAAASLATALSSEAMFDLAASKAVEIVSVVDREARSTLFSLADGDWKLVSECNGSKRTLTTEMIDVLCEIEKQPIQQLPLGAPLDVVGADMCYGTVLALTSRNQLRGVLVISTARPIPAATMPVLVTWTSQVSLALAAAVLAEDLHRQRSERRFRALVEKSGDLIIVLDEAEGITFSSPSADRLLGGRRGDIRALLAAVHEEDQGAVLNLFQSASRSNMTRSIECRLIDPEEDIYWFEISATDMRSNPEIGGIVLNAHNITERKGLEQSLRHQVLHDALTGIANRVLLRDRLQHSLDARQDSHHTALLFIDIDDFKTVNDSLGHAAGDELLKIVAFRIQSYIRSEDTAARFGGDEFAVLLNDMDDEAYAVEVGERLLEVVSQPIDFDGREISVKASVGIAFGETDLDGDAVLRNADAAMYHAKWHGKGNVQVFDVGMYQKALERLEIKADLGRAISRNELKMYFQPLVTLKDESLAGFEALLRWNHSSKGFVSPALFVPLAEETGLICEIGEFVLRESVGQLVKWNNLTNTYNLKMSINVSPRQLEDDSFVETFSKVLKSVNVLPEQLILELTESAAIDRPDTRQRLQTLRDFGVEIAADDFGSGFASYAALQQLPFTVVKLDRSLIMGMPDETGRAEAQVRSIIEMAHATNLKVVAEGIEEPVQRDILKSMDCDRGQGYLFSRPMPAVEAVEWVTQRTLGHANL